MEGMENNNGVPPIEPVLKNETPAAVSDAVVNVVLFLEKYGWFVILVAIISVLIWSKLEPYWRKWKQKRDKQFEAAIDPNKLAKCQESLEVSRRRMQENLDAKAKEFAEKKRELEAQKRQENIDDWEMHQQGRGYKSKHAKNDGGKPSQNQVKPKKSDRLRTSEDYNPLSGSSSGSSFRPNRRNTGGG